MNYELAKKLKGAGFPQDIKIGKEIAYGGSVSEGTYWEARLPDLSELIEACGVEFDSLSRIAGLAWSAKSFSQKGNNLSEKGNSPEEAVANLWLELNKNVPK